METEKSTVSGRVVSPPHYTGTLAAHAEMGSDGWWWMIEQEHPADAPDRSGSDFLVAVEEGDYLEVFNDQGERLWAGEIRGDKTYGWYPDWANVLYGQQQVAGHDVHWVQKCDDPEAWAAMFFEQRRARLTKVVERRTPPESPGLTPEVLPGLSDADLQRVTPSLVYGLVLLFDDLTDAELAILYGVAVDEIQRWRTHPETAVLARAQVPRLVLAMELYRSVRNLTYNHPGEKEKWLRHAQPALDGQTPLAFIQAGGNAALAQMVAAASRGYEQRRADWLASLEAQAKGQAQA